MGRESASVFVGNLSDNARNEDVDRFFKGYGKLRDVSLKGGYGFVEFDDEYDAKDAVRDLDGKEICGQKVRIELSNGGRDRRRGSQRSRSRSRGRRRKRDSSESPEGRKSSYFEKTAYRKYGPPQRSKWTIEINNLSERVSWQDLKDFFRRVGEVTYGEAHDRTRCGPGRGVICFERRKDMEKAAKEYHGYNLKDRKMELRIAVDGNYDSDRSRSRSRDRSRSRSGSRRSKSRSRREKYRSPSRRSRRSRSRSRRSRSRSRRSRSRSRRSRSRSRRSRTRSRNRRRSRSRSDRSRSHSERSSSEESTSSSSS